MRLLSFDTSTSDLHICLADQGQVVASEIVKSRPDDRQYAAAILIPTIQDLLTRVGWSKADLETLVVGIGPGGFTGVRIAVVCARTIAQALKLPLIGISILECYVFQHAACAGVVLGAGKEGFYVAAYDVVPIGSLVEHASINQALARQSDLVCISSPIYTNKEGITVALKGVKYCLTEDKTRSYLGDIQANVQVLPKLDNIAVVQAQLAFNRLCIAKALNLKQPDNGSNCQSLLLCFPHESVRPLYLQNASITKKGAN